MSPMVLFTNSLRCGIIGMQRSKHRKECENAELWSKIKRSKKNARLTQTELAEKVMVSVQAISKWECGVSQT